MLCVFLTTFAWTDGVADMSAVCFQKWSKGVTDLDGTEDFAVRLSDIDKLSRWYHILRDIIALFKTYCVCYPFCRIFHVGQRAAAIERAPRIEKLLTIGVDLIRKGNVRSFQC